MLQRALATRLSATLITLLVGASTAFAQAPTAPPATDQGGTSASDGWSISVYPILAWVPTNISVDLNLPGGGGGGGGGIAGVIEDSRLTGAFLGGVGATNGAWRIDSNVMWAALGGDRISTPRFSVDVDVIYAYGSVARRLAKGIYVTGGVRRLALNYDITVPGSAPISRKPGVWDPLVGVAYHKLGPKLDLHGSFEGGGFGVGSDSEYAAYFRADWKPWRHVGITAGYGVLIFKVSDTVLGRELVAEQNLNGPMIGLGLYF